MSLFIPIKRGKRIVQGNSSRVTSANATVTGHIHFHMRGSVKGTVIQTAAYLDFMSADISGVRIAGNVLAVHCKEAIHAISQSIGSLKTIDAADTGIDPAIAVQGTIDEAVHRFAVGFVEAHGRAYKTAAARTARAGLHGLSSFFDRFRNNLHCFIGNRIAIA